MDRRTLRIAAVTLLAGVGLWQVGHGAWIYVKA